MRFVSFHRLRRGRQVSYSSKGTQAIHRQLRKSKGLVNRFLLLHTETMGHGGTSNKQAFLGSSVSATLTAQVISSSFKQVLLPHSFREGESQTFFPSRLFLNNNQLKITNISKKACLVWQTLLSSELHLLTAFLYTKQQHVL